MCTKKLRYRSFKRAWRAANWHQRAVCPKCADGLALGWQQAASIVALIWSVPVVLSAAVLLIVPIVCRAWQRFKGES